MKSRKSKAAYLFGVGIAILGGAYTHVQSQEVYTYKLSMQSPKQAEKINLDSQGMFKRIMQPGHFHVNSMPRRIVNSSSEPLKLQINMEGVPADFMLYTGQLGWHRLDTTGNLEIGPDCKVLFRIDVHMERTSALALDGKMLRLTIQEKNQDQKQHVHCFFMINK
jgi:hypothetical protein